MSQKHYAVKEGRCPGIYGSWDEAKKQVDGYSGAIYKSFKTLSDAEDYLGILSHSQETTPAPKKTIKEEKEVATTFKAIPSSGVEAYVDGSFDKASGFYSFGVVLVNQNEVIETLQRSNNNPDYKDSHQIAGEVFGCLHAIQLAIKNGFKQITIYYDYLGIEKWASKEWKAKKTVSKDYVTHFNRLSKHIQVDFVKVKAHSGVMFNEMADELAKEAIALKDLA